MTISRAKRSRAAAVAAVLLAGVAVPAIGHGQRQDSPESLLPPGFDQPAPAPAPAPAPSAPRPAAPETVQPIPAPDALPADDAPANAAALALPADEAPVSVDLTRYELPDFARHSLARVGVTAAGNLAFPADAFGAANGRYLQTLLARLNAPIASRWASIALRRALMSPLDTPPGTNGADFAAQRAWVLLRMGEANAARAVIADVDTDNYTTNLYQVAMQAAMAAGDPAALCPIVDAGAAQLQQRGWSLAQAMCAGLAGKPTEAVQLLRSARSGTSPSDMDNLLAEKIVGSGAEGRRAVTIEWAGVPDLTAWRWGLATATGVEVPADLYGTAGPQVRYWQALSPNLDPVARVASAELAATAGVFSSAGLVDLYGEIDDNADASSPEARIGRDLRIAYSDGNAGARLKALRSLWDAAETPRTRYARLILTARAASWMPLDAKLDAPEPLIASMLSAGYEMSAAEWRGVVKPGTGAWGLIALADPVGRRVSYGDLNTFTNGESRRKAQLFLAGLAGLGRLAAADAERGAQALDVSIGGANDWTRAIDQAGQRGEAGTVALLAAVGLQSRGWEPVSPEALFHIVAAMRAAGMEHYARMIAVEAVTRA